VIVAVPLPPEALAARGRAASIRDSSLCFMFDLVSGARLPRTIARFAVHAGCDGKKKIAGNPATNISLQP
jgi:hypothetical protein